MRLVAKHAQVGYQTPGQRPGCRNCMHCNRIETTGFTLCVKHGFEVTSGGICNSHKLKRKAGEAELVFLRRQRDLLDCQVAELVDVVEATKEQNRRARDYLASFDGRMNSISRGRVIPRVGERRA